VCNRISIIGDKVGRCSCFNDLWSDETMRGYSVTALLWFLLLISGTELFGQTTIGNVLSKKIATSMVAEYIESSEHCTYILLVDGDNIACVEVETGQLLWTKAAKGDVDILRQMTIWRGDDTVVVPSNSALLFVRAKDGFVFDSVRYNNCRLRDFERKVYKAEPFDVLEPRVRGNVMIVPQKSTFDVIDLNNHKLIYRSTYRAAKQRAIYYGDFVLLASEGDTNVIVDIRHAKLVAKLDVEDHEIDKKFVQPFFANGNYGVVIHDDGAFVVDFQSREVKNLLFDSGDLESIGAVIPSGNLLLFMQTDTELFLLNSKTASFAWRKKCDEYSLGMMIAPYHHTDTSALISFQDIDKMVYLASVRYSDGTIHWRTKFVQSKSLWLTQLSERMFNPHSLANSHLYPTDSLRLSTYWSIRSRDTTFASTDEDYVEIVNEWLVHMFSPAPVGVVPFRIDGDVVSVATAGRCRRAWDGAVCDTVWTGEGIHTVNALTGVILSSKVFPVLRNIEDLDIYGSQLSPLPISGGHIMAGNQNILFVRSDGTVDTSGFSTTRHEIDDVGFDYYTAKYADKNGRRYVVHHVFSSSGIQRSVLLFSEVEISLAFGLDTTHAYYTLRVEPSSISVLPLQSAVPKQWPAPLHTIDKKMLEAAKVGSIDDEDARILVLEDRLLVFGSKGSAVYSFATKQLVPLLASAPLRARDVSIRIRQLSPRSLLLVGDDRFVLLEILDEGAMKVLMDVECDVYDSPWTYDYKTGRVLVYDMKERLLNVGKVR